MKGMRATLSLLFKKSIELGDEGYSEKQIDSQWIGNPPATIEEINNTEERLQLKLPADYKDLLYIANGFPTSSWAVEPSFESIDKVDFYRNFEGNVIEIWKELGELDDIMVELEKAILIAGLNEVQQFLIIPRDEQYDDWRYWKFANWIPGEEKFDNLTRYILSVIEFLNMQIENNEMEE